MRSLCCALLITGVLPAFLAADSLSPIACPDATLAVYESAFGSSPTAGPQFCSDGILNFSGFDFQAIGTGAVGADQINLTPIDPGTANTGDTGFTISGLSAQPGQNLTYVIDWFFDIDAGPTASGAQLGMDPPTGDVSITQYYCVDSNLSPYSTDRPSCSSIPGTNVVPPLQFITVTVPNPQGSITFNPIAQNSVDVRTVIRLDGGDAQTGAVASFDSLSGSTTIDPGAPEPASALLMPAALLAVLHLRRRKLNATRV